MNKKIIKKIITEMIGSIITENEFDIKDIDMDKVKTWYVKCKEKYIQLIIIFLILDN